MRIHSHSSLRIALAAALVLSAAVVVNRADPAAAGEVGSDDFQISTATPQPTESRVAYNATDDELLVVWTSVDGALEPRIYGQLLDAADGSNVGGEFLIAELNGGDPTTGYIEPAVAWNSTDNEYAVVFSGDDTTDTGLITTTFEIYARRVSAAGTPLGTAPARISDMGTDDTNGNLDAREPDIAYDSDTNSYLVVWEGDDDTAPLVNGELEIFGQLLAADLTESGGDVRLSDMGIDGVASSDARSPAVAFLPGASARYLVVWEGDDNSPIFEIYGQYVDTSGTEIGSDFLVSTEPTNDEAYAPDVAADPTTGQFMAVWEHDNGALNDFEVDGALLSTTGVTSVFDVSESGDATWIVNTPAVAYNATLDLFSVVWTGDHLGLTAADEYEVIHVLLDPATGAAADPEERISTMGVDGVASSAVTNADVAPASGGTFVAVWSAENPPAPPAGQSEVWGQLLGRNADLSITKTLTSAPNPGPGDTVTYTIAYANNGPANATDVRIVDPIPAGFDVVSAVASDPTLVADAAETLAWDLPTLATGDGGTIALTLTVNGDAVDGQVIVNSASISSTGDTGDPVPANNTANAAAVTIDFPPAVTIDQGAGQVDPTNVASIIFDVAFSEAVSGFTDADVSLGGTAGATTAVVAGGPATYTVTVTGMTGDGTVTASIPADAAIDGSGKGNTASTSTDNEVTYDVTPPSVTVEQGATQPDPTDVPSIVFDVVFSEDVVGFDPSDVVLGGTSNPTTAVVAADDAANYTITVTGMTLGGTVTASIVAGGATDTAGNPNTASTSLDNEVTFTVNAPPQLSDVVITNVNENGVATLSGTIADPDSGDSFTLNVDWGDGSPIDIYNYPAGTTSFTETHQYLDDDPSGTAQDDYAVGLTLSDNAGGVAIDSATVTVSNVAPQLSNVAITSVVENGVATLSGNISDVGTLDTFTLDVDWGDGSPIDTFNYPAGTTSFTETHQYLDDDPSGTPQDDYTVALTLTDDDTGSVGDAVTVTVFNVAPQLSNVAVTSVVENGVATLSGNISDVGTLDTFSLDVDWGDGSTDTFIYPAGTTSFVETHLYLDDDPSGTAQDDYTVAVTLTDDDTGSVGASATVTVFNVAPVIDALAVTPSLDEGGAVILIGSFTDPGILDTFTVEVDWDDGSPLQIFNYPAGTTLFVVTHQYLDDGLSPGNGTAADIADVTVTVSDDDTGTATGSVQTLVNNVAPALAAVAITDVAENGVATLSGNIVDPGILDAFTVQVDWGDGSTVETFSYGAGTTVFSETHQYLDDNPTATPQDDYTVAVTVTDDDTGTTTETILVTVSNVAPVLANVAITDVDEDGIALLRADISDVGTLDSFVLDVDWGDGSPIATFSYPAGTTSIAETHRYLDDNPSGTAQDDYTVSLTLVDDDTGSDTDSTIVTVSNVAPVVTVTPNPITAQYSDAAPAVSIMASDVAGDPMTASTEWSDGGPFVAGLPAGLTLTTGACAVVAATNSRTCSWTIDGDTTLALGTYTIRVSVADHDLGVTAVDVGLTVAPEDATVTFDEANPVAVPVTADGSDASEPFTLVVHVQETQPDVGTGPAPGDINLAEVTVTLDPVGPGSPVSTTCTSTGAVPAFDYDSILTVECDFAGVPVNTYVAVATAGGGYYTGAAEDVVTVYDPSLGFTTGGGTYVDTNGDRVNFGYTMKYNKKRTNVQGSLLVIRHTDDGVYRLKSNRIDGLAIGSAGDFSWASFTGKATYKEPDWDDAVGNYEFIAYVEDHATPGAGADRFWITANRKGELASGLSMDSPAGDNAVTLTGGNIVVPHQGGGRGGPR